MDLLNRILIFSLCFLIYTATIAQKEASKWFFGGQAGLNFMTTPPSLIVGSPLGSWEGCASISDTAGNFLFSTDGQTVYTQQHQVMPNGTGLAGGFHSTQSALIIKQPGNSNIYFIFMTTNTAYPAGLNYSTLDMNLAAGVGSVTSKNNLLQTPTCEKIAAVKHCNGRDIWVVTHDYNSAHFRSFLVTSAGVQGIPALSLAGPVISNSISTIGQMKISPNGKKLVFINGNINVFHVFDFDAATGIVSNPIDLTFPTGNGSPAFYGAEFSPDGSKVYVTTHVTAHLVQFDLCAGTEAQINNSAINVANSSPNETYAALQLAIDGKIYVARSLSSHLAVINNPNAAGTLCNASSATLNVSPAAVLLGLPAFMASYFNDTNNPHVTLNSTLSCNTASFSMHISPSFSTTTCSSVSNNITGFLWNFGEPSSPLNSSSLQNPVHIYQSGGLYEVQLIILKQCGSDTIKKKITLPTPTINISPSTGICEGQQIILTATGVESYTWSTGAVTSTIQVSPVNTTTYSVAGNTSTNNCRAFSIVTVNVVNCSYSEEFSGQLKKVLIFPNPFSGKLQIETEENTELMIINQLGLVVYKSTLNPGKSEISTDKIPAGIYQINVIGNSPHYRKLVKLKE